MSERQLIPGHKMTLEVVPVTRHSSSWNMDYEGSDLFMVCECGERVQVHALLGERSQEERLICIEHSIRALGNPQPKGLKESFGETPADRYA